MEGKKQETKTGKEAEPGKEEEMQTDIAVAKEMLAEISDPEERRKTLEDFQGLLPEESFVVLELEFAEKSKPNGKVEHEESGEKAPDSAAPEESSDASYEAGDQPQTAEEREMVPAYRKEKKEQLERLVLRAPDLKIAEEIISHFASRNLVDPRDILVLKGLAAFYHGKRAEAKGEVIIPEEWIRYRDKYPEGGVLAPDYLEYTARRAAELFLTELTKEVGERMDRFQERMAKGETSYAVEDALITEGLVTFKGEEDMEGIGEPYALEMYGRALKDETRNSDVEYFRSRYSLQRELFWVLSKTEDPAVGFGRLAESGQLAHILVEEEIRVLRSEIEYYLHEELGLARKEILAELEERRREEEYRLEEKRREEEYKKEQEEREVSRHWEEKAKGSVKELKEMRRSVYRKQPRKSRSEIWLERQFGELAAELRRAERPSFERVLLTYPSEELLERYRKASDEVKHIFEQVNWSRFSETFKDELFQEYMLVRERERLHKEYQDLCQAQERLGIRAKEIADSKEDSEAELPRELKKDLEAYSILEYNFWDKVDAFEGRVRWRTPWEGKPPKPTEGLAAPEHKEAAGSGIITIDALRKYKEKQRAKAREERPYRILNAVVQEFTDSLRREQQMLLFADIMGEAGGEVVSRERLKEREKIHSVLRGFSALRGMFRDQPWEKALKAGREMSLLPGEYIKDVRRAISTRLERDGGKEAAQKHKHK